ncbi:unnamed protein product [Caenorhabditis angaria]|uniref:Uncharacterized protein n=1 Tax=Caenorhabditis angaria TaxID=860376 RepID=A0A9P1NAG4_9PELO|nr:unnamed protein product [Caenorhabditis angaria]
MEHDMFFKLVLIGDSNVGKTSINHRFCEGSFEEIFPWNHLDFKVKAIEMKGKKIKLGIWDTIGSERFVSFSTSYCRHAKGIILVYDVTDEETFDNIEEWLRRIGSQASKDVVKMLVGNKCDLTAQRVVSKERGERLARDHQMIFHEISAKNNVNVDTAFNDLVAAILEKIPELSDEWVVVEENVPPEKYC